MPIPVSAPKRERDTAPSTATECDFSAIGGCTGLVVVLTERNIEHEPTEDRVYNEVTLCVAHRRCMTCDSPVPDEEFAVIDVNGGVACSRFEHSAEDVEAACSFYCGACDRVVLAEFKNHCWDDANGDAMFRCVDCSGPCHGCGEQTDEGKCADGTFYCDGCGDKVDEDDDEESSSTGDTTARALCRHEGIPRFG
jgi:hypothetical protein